MEYSFSTEALPTAKMAASTIRETLLKVCRHYQDPGLGAMYTAVASYYENQVKAIPQPPVQARTNKQQTGSTKLHS